ncbi:methyl-accepting chemotaxis protein [uncultured Erythrobacter sp.]|uniref:methyl-accepting chemotaxis protein n=1 Tax=uncultured Erythrobacter sp. TaxID=263913 RepID=UPI00260493B3|nr:methyl-accepting chemotaxis protein [uncultured Erythrobacter sp.]
MNMMTPQDELEEQATPIRSDDLSRSFEIDQHSIEDRDAGDASIDRFGWFHNLSIRAKVHAIFGAFFGISFTMTLVLGLALGEGWLRYSEAVSASDAMNEARQLRMVAGDMRYNTVRYLFAGEETILDRQREAYEAAKARIAALEQMTAPGRSEGMTGYAADVAQIRTALENYDVAFSRAASAQEGGESPERMDRLGRTLSALGDGFLIDAREVADRFDELRRENQEIGLAYFRNMLILVIILALAAFVILVGGLRYLSHDFSRKVVEVSDGMTKLARGNRDFEIEGQERKDEIGQMIRALALFKRGNQQLEIWAHERTEQAAKEVRLEQERAAERSEIEQRKAAILEEVALELERTVGEVVASVASASGQLGSTAQKMAATANEARKRAEGLVDHMDEASEGAASAAAASDEFAVSIGEISRQAAASSQMARLARDATEEADTTVCELATSAEQVGNIVQLISTIAQRTNLLALNASIEAARGGGAGRGFAVVASEVKELAMQTSRATSQISSQIRAMQASTDDSVGALKAIAEQVKQLEGTSVSIASAVDQQSVAGQELARSIDRAARGTEQVSDHINDVREMSLSTGIAANQVLSSANELETQAATLSTQVRTFLARVREG